APDDLWTEWNADTLVSRSGNRNLRCRRLKRIQLLTGDLFDPRDNLAGIPCYLSGHRPKPGGTMVVTRHKQAAVWSKAGDIDRRGMSQNRSNRLGSGDIPKPACSGTVADKHHRAVGTEKSGGNGAAPTQGRSVRSAACRFPDSNCTRIITDSAHLSGS